MEISVQPKYIKLTLLILAICNIFLGEVYLKIFSGSLKIREHDADDEIPHRRLVRMLPDGECEWVEPKPVNQDPNFDIFSTVIVSYPGSAKRAAHTLFSGLTELTTRDDFYLNETSPIQRYAFYKTQYPHHEGIWSWDAACRQSVYVLQNPRRALITYHFILYEIYFSTQWWQSYEALHRVFTLNAPLDSWDEWRDLRMRSEIRQWGWHIDYWMEGGLMRDFYTNEITTPEHFDRLKHPERFSEGELRAFQNGLINVQPTYDGVCDQIESGCQPVTVTSYESIIRDTTGPLEANKLASVIKNKVGLEVAEGEGIYCTWKKIQLERASGIRDDRDRVGPAFEDYEYTLEEMLLLVEEIERVRDKYSSPEWENDENAQLIVVYMEDYIYENQVMIRAM